MSHGGDSFRPTPGMWAAWIGLPGIPIPFVLFDIAKFGWNGSLERNLESAFFMALVPPLCAAIWLSRFKLEFSADRLIYRSWGGTRTVEFSQIDDVTASRVTPLSKAPVGAYVHLNDGSRLLVYLKLFSLAAAARLFALRKTSNNRWRGL